MDSIEHGNEASEEQLRQMRDKGIFLDLTPTAYYENEPPNRHAFVLMDSTGTVQDVHEGR